MKISTKGRYALRMLADLAENQGDGYLSLNDIAARQEISKKYLEQIAPMLIKAGLLRTNRGSRGGCRLNKAADSCTVGDVLRATEGSLAPVSCLEHDVNDCPKCKRCTTLYVWEELYALTNRFFDSITIQDILDHNINNFNV